MAAKSITQKTVWQTLRNLVIDPYIETKGGGSFAAKFINFTTVYTLVKNEFPDLDVQFTMFTQPDGSVLDCMYYRDGSAAVECTINIGGHLYVQTLGVMDFKFNAVQNPNARQIQDAKARCEAKCFSRAGLGIKLWMSEDPMTQENGKSTSNNKPVVVPSVKKEASPLKSVTATTGSAGVLRLPNGEGATNG